MSTEEGGDITAKAAVDKHWFLVLNQERIGTWKRPLPEMEPVWRLVSHWFLSFHSLRQSKPR